MSTISEREQKRILQSTIGQLIEACGQTDPEGQQILLSELSRTNRQTAKVYVQESISTPPPPPTLQPKPNLS